jgi:hypothetical protein
MSIHSQSLELPEAAPLVYPVMDPGDPLYNPFRWTLKILGNYFDRRAQAKYAKKMPPKALAAMAPAEQIYDHSPSWLTVGTVSPYPLDGGVETIASRERVIGKETLEKKTKPNKGTGRSWFKEDVLYLMIVNMPTKSDLAAVKGSMLL